MGRLLVPLLPAVVLLSCGAEAPEIEAAGSSCDGDGCSRGGAVLEEALEVELSAEGSGTGQVRYSLRNDGTLTQRVLPRETPIGAGMEAFDVRRNGEPVAYVGPDVTWPPPASADLVLLEPGEAVAGTIDLSKLYDMTKPGQYSVKVRQLSGSTSYQEIQTQVWAAPAMSDGAPEVIVSVDAEHVSVPVEESVEKAIFIQIDPNFRGNCSVAQTGDVGTDETVALTYLRDIINSRANLIATSPSALAALRLRSAFNATTVTDRTFVLDTYQGIRNFIEDTIYVCSPETNGLSCANGSGVTGDCCNVSFPGAVAVTRQPQNTMLCPAYFDFSSPSRARFLIHEASHQDRTGPGGVGARDPGGIFNNTVVSFPGIHTAASYETFADKCTPPTSCF